MVRVLGEAQRLQEIVAGLSVYHILPKHEYPQALQKRPQIIRGSKETLVSVTIHLTQLIMIELHTTNPQPQPLLPLFPPTYFPYKPPRTRKVSPARAATWQVPRSPCPYPR